MTDHSQPRPGRIPPDRGLHRFEDERDACGVGLVAELSNRPSHRLVEQALTVLRNLMHRGAAGGDPETGDGAGLLLSLPDRFFRRERPELPPPGHYGVAMIFGGTGDEAELEALARAQNLAPLGWREVPTHPEKIGRAARESCPRIRQLFLDGSAFAADRKQLERKLYLFRRLAEKALPELYFCSCSTRSIVYKGLLLATQLEGFYPDLADPEFTSALALVHQRYSTNTFPTWELAHPFRYLAHNGEINTLRGNLNQLRCREPELRSDLWGEKLSGLLPLIDPGVSDSAALDRMFELLVSSGRDLCHAMLMLLPQAWGRNYHLGRDVRGFFEFHSALLEPWDGPAAVAFSDGINAGAALDRNGLRPARYALTRDGLFVLASEAGVLELPAAEVVRRGRLRPGELIYCDLEHHRLVGDAELKALAARRRPYRRWDEENRISVHGLFSAVTPSAAGDDPTPELRRFGYTREELNLILQPMAVNGREPVGSMGDDAAPAALSERPRRLFDYFRQQFAQVTNPPIDPIREELVMSLTTYIGNPGNLLAESPEQARVIKLPRPVLTDDELNRLRAVPAPGFGAVTLSLGFRGTLAEALAQLRRRAVEAVRSGHRILILSDRQLPERDLAIPSLLAAAAVNRALLESGLRCSSGVIVESGEVFEVMHFALLLGHGATAVNPYLALRTISHLADTGKLECDATTAAGNYLTAVDRGLLKVMSKMGISTLRSYRSAQLFEALGLDPALVAEYFPGTVSRIGGATLTTLEEELRRRGATGDSGAEPLAPGSHYRFRRGGEPHQWTPPGIALLRQAAQNNDPESYRAYTELINQQTARNSTLRGLLDFAATTPVPLAEVEPVESILKRFVSGAMSLGSLSPEAHETIAVAMNRLGARSNCGEGGEDPDRSQPGPHGENRASAIRQVASGRFGVTIDYLRGASELQIKMAQGAKPGEGGQLPGSKVDDFIARIRHATPGLTLISPPPHHDIYSIEDLAQLIYDLRCANPRARISVKLVSEAGVGPVAAGVAKAHADTILISGGDGGTGAAPLTSIQHAGLPWELGLAEAHQTLIRNQLRQRVRLQVDGQLKTGRDVVMAALLGAEEFGFATVLLVALGCVMDRRCHTNACPAGLATQDPEKRKCFRGRPEHLENLLRFIAGEVREILAELGLRSLDEAVGRVDLLRLRSADLLPKAQLLDLSRMLDPTAGGPVRYDPATRETVTGFDRRELLPRLHETLERGVPAELSLKLRNVDRTVGAELSGELVTRFGSGGLPDDTIKVHFRGTAGQSFGAFLAPGITFELEGEANDFVGKGLSGGRIVVRPPACAPGPAAENVIAGNVIGYGGTAGKIFLNGQAGERFLIRNSGVTAVVEGVGDHGCEYMTGGRALILGPTGVNFGAGMTGGVAYVYDRDNDFDLRCNPDTVDLEPVLPGSSDEEELLGLLREHLAATGSVRAGELLADWSEVRGRFVKVLPVEYRRALLARRAKTESEAERVQR